MLAQYLAEHLSLKHETSRFKMLEEAGHGAGMAIGRA